MQGEMPMRTSPKEKAGGSDPPTPRKPTPKVKGGDFKVLRLPRTSNRPGKVCAIGTAWLTLIYFFMGCAGFIDERAAIAQESEGKFGTGSATSVRLKERARVKIAVFQDQTESVDQNRVPVLTEAHLRRIEQLVIARGGEVALGAIRDESNRSLIRFFVPATPETPSAQRTNIFIASAKTKALTRAKEQWQAEVESERARFHAQAIQLLRNVMKARSTDVVAAVNRGRLFLEEPDVPHHPIVVFITDGLDGHRTPVRLDPFPPGTSVIAVSGTRTIGILSVFKPIRFENIDGAIRFLEAERGAE